MIQIRGSPGQAFSSMVYYRQRRWVRRSIAFAHLSEETSVIVDGGKH